MFPYDVITLNYSHKTDFTKNQQVFSSTQELSDFIAGFLSTLSCEASVLILTLITRDRLVSVTRPLDRHQPSLRRATLLVAALWLVAAVIALLPLSSETVDYFGEEFYGGNGVCLPLHVQDPFAQVSIERFYITSVYSLYSTNFDLFHIVMIKYFRHEKYCFMKNPRKK